MFPPDSMKRVKPHTERKYLHQIEQTQDVYMCGCVYQS